MKSLSERIKDFPASQFVDWLCLACVDVREVRTPEDSQDEINKIREAVTERLATLEDQLRIKKNHIRLRDTYIEELEQRAGDAEAKLAEMKKQTPVGRVDRGQVTDSNEYPNARVICLHDQADWENFQDGTELFLHSATVINEAELVPEVEALRAAFEEVERQSDEGFNLHRYDTVYADDETQERWDLWLSCRAAILRNIEGSK